MATSGSFKSGDSRWAADVKGKPGFARCYAPLTSPAAPASGKGMNDPEVTMPDARPIPTLVAHSKALEAAGTAIKLVMRVPAPLKSIADQVIRSASSVPANLAEGHGRFGRDRQHFWRIAYGSAKEVESHLRLLARTGVVDSAAVETVLAAFDEVRAMTWRLLNPRIG
jgi:four helix bundle protein